MATIDRLRELVRNNRARQGAAPHGARPAAPRPAPPPSGAALAPGDDAVTEDASGSQTRAMVDAASDASPALDDERVVRAGLSAAQLASVGVSLDASPSPAAAVVEAATESDAAAGLRELTYEPVDESGLPLPTPAPITGLTGASRIDTPLGHCILIDHLFDADRPYGRQLVRQGTASLREVLDYCGRPLAPVEDASPSSGLLFLDLETTGLSGGAGTLAFLVGCGFFTEEGFRTRQFLLPSFASERAVMHAVTELIGKADCLVTYNGRTFDIPVMETRWLFHRATPPWTHLPHLDMLPVARRLWRERDEVARNGCRLVTLEQVLFGVAREGDVPGWEIPGRYFDYIRGGDAALLEPVLHHNRLDLLSLALVTARAMRLVREGAAGTYDPQECLAVGRELWRRRQAERALDCFRKTADGPTTSGHVRGEALHASARLLRRERRFVEAADAWTRLAACRGARPALLAEAREALAIHYEHRARNLDKAHEWAAGAFEAEAPGSRREAVAYRLARLRRKIRVQTESGPRTALLLDELS